MVVEGGELAGEIDALLYLLDRVAADDGCADGERESVEEGLVFGEGAGCGGDGSAAFPGFFLDFDGGRGPGGEDAAAGHDLHADDAHLFFDGHGKELFGEAVVEPVGGVEAHEDGVEGEAADAFHEGFGAEAAGDAEIADHLLFAGLLEGFDGSAFGEDLVDVFLNAYVVELPGVDVVGVEELEGDFEVFECGVAGALFGFAGDEDLIAVALEGFAEILLAPAIGAAVDGGGVEVVDS